MFYPLLFLSAFLFIHLIYDVMNTFYSTILLDVFKMFYYFIFVLQCFDTVS